ncbi:MAG: hypothetical protein JNJ48_00190 [Phycisphaerae bacterium]|nr:hypothetical protein [Phycisphaerae bacterium]
MHDPTAQGTDFFKCDFCRRPWREDRPMVEGHRGSLVCADCLTAAHLEIVNEKRPGHRPPEHGACTMCLERRDEPHWQSPLFDGAFICRRCIRQSAQTLAKDPDSGWTRPGAPATAGQPTDETDSDAD